MEHVLAVAELHRLTDLSKQEAGEKRVASLVHYGGFFLDRYFGAILRFQDDE